MSRKHRHHRRDNCCCQSRYSGFNPCSTLPTLLILFQSGLLCNDRAYILVLLFLACGGIGGNGCGFGGNSCGCGSSNNCCC